MDGEGSASLVAWLIDLAAAAIAGAAVAFSLALLGKPLAGLPAGAGVLLLSFASLQRVRPGAPRYRLPALQVLEWPAAPAAEPLELTEVEPLLLDTPAPEPRPRVVRLFPAAPLPSPGELKSRIDAHLGSRPEGPEENNLVLLSPDASAALRSALGELKRALR